MFCFHPLGIFLALLSLPVFDALGETYVPNGSPIDGAYWGPHGLPRDESRTKTFHTWKNEECSRLPDCEKCQGIGEQCYWHADNVCRPTCLLNYGCLRAPCDTCEKAEVIGLDRNPECTKKCPAYSYGCYPNCDCDMPNMRFDPVSGICMTKPKFAVSLKIMQSYFKLSGKMGRLIPPSPSQNTDPGNPEATKDKMKKIKMLHSMGTKSIIEMIDDPTLKLGAFESVLYWILDWGRADAFDDILEAFCMNTFPTIYDSHHGYQRYNIDINKWRNAMWNSLVAREYYGSATKEDPKPPLTRGQTIKRNIYTDKQLTDDITVGVKNYAKQYYCQTVTTPGPGVGAAMVDLCGRKGNWVDCDFSLPCKWVGPKCTSKEKPKKTKAKEGEGEGGETKEGEGKKKNTFFDEFGPGPEKRAQTMSDDLFTCFHIMNEISCSAKSECTWIPQPSGGFPLPSGKLPWCGGLGQVCCSSCKCIQRGLLCIYGTCQECMQDEQCPKYKVCMQQKNPELELPAPDADKMNPLKVEMPQLIWMCSAPDKKELENIDTMSGQMGVRNDLMKCLEMTDTTLLNQLANSLRWIDREALGGANIADGHQMDVQSSLRKLGGLSMLVMFFIVPLVVMLAKMMVCVSSAIFGWGNALRPLTNGPMGTMVSFLVMMIWKIDLGCGSGGLTKTFVSGINTFWNLMDAVITMSIGVVIEFIMDALFAIVQIAIRAILGTDGGW